MKKIETKNAPHAVGPYSQAVVTGNLVFCSGQIALVPETGDLLAGNVQAQTEQVCRNLAAVVAAAGSSLDHVVKAEVFLKDMNDFAVMNEVYATYFNGNVLPARTTVEVAQLPKGALVEIACIATVH